MTDGPDRKVVLDKIWADDRLERRELAQQLEDYICARFAHPAPGGGSFTIAVEGPYGQGKSFFLDRLAEQLAYSHPVACVNAWADDTADDPLTSIFLAIEESLAHRVKQQDPAKKAKTVQKVKDVAKIAAKVMVRAAGARLLTSDGLKELEGAFESGVDDLFGMKSAESLSPPPLANRRTLIEEFRTRLTSLLDALEEDGLFARPLVVIVDELDRCRPTYAIRLLEEAKHFFDDTGVVFVYGMNRAALAATVKSIYGDEFPAQHYLARFVRRQVNLKNGTLKDFVKHQFEINAVLTKKFVIPGHHGSDQFDIMCGWMSDLFLMNSIHARDAEYVLEHVFSFAAMWDHDCQIQLPYLAQLAVRRYRSERGDMGSQLETPSFGSPHESASQAYEVYAEMDLLDLQTSFHESGPPRPILDAILPEVQKRGQAVGHGWQRLKSVISQYPERLAAVGKFLVSPTDDSYSEENK